MSLSKIAFCLVVISVIGRVTNVAAQSANDTPSAITQRLTEQVEAFFDNLTNASVNAEDAFSELLADGPLGERPEQLSDFVDRYKKLELEPSYGRFLAAKQVHVKRVGDDLAFLTFLYETEYFPVVWRFAFYRPPLESPERSDWFVVRLSFDTKLEQLSSLP